MSADNWAVCPRFDMHNERDRRIARRRADAAYGKVSKEKWLALEAKANAPTPNAKRTLREDWEISTESEGKFYIRYYSGCSVCGFQHTFKHDSYVVEPKVVACVECHEEYACDLMDTKDDPVHCPECRKI